MTILTQRLNEFERRLHGLERELAELRRLAAAEAAPREPEPPLWETMAPEPPPAPQPTPTPTPAPAPVRSYDIPPPPAPPREPLDLSFLFSARALAWTGGAVTLLGIVFFFVLAVERGWIGPEARVALGAAASAAAFGGGLWLRRRYGDTYAAVSAVGAGIAGAYATTLAAAALYDLVPPLVALAAAAVVAAAGAAVAIAWNAETIAGLGLVGAIVVPVPVAFQGGPTALGTAFVAVVLAATAVVAVRREWRALLVVAACASAPQIAVLVVQHERWATPLAVAFWLVYAGAGLALALRSRLSQLPASFVVGSAAFAGYSAAILYDGRAEGVALLVVALAYAAGAAALFVRERNVSSLLWAVALAVGAVAAADLASGATLTIVWSAEAAVLAWLARRIDEPRFQLASLGWLVLALVHGVGVDTPPARLFVESAHPGGGVPSAVALAAAFALVGLATFTWERRDEGRLLAHAMEDLRVAQPHLRVVAVAVAALAAVYAASLATLAAIGPWDWAHVGVASLWSAVAVGVLLAGLRLGDRRLQVGGIAWTAASIALVLGYDLPQLDPTARSWSFAVVALASLVVALAYQLRGPSEALDAVAVAGVAASAALAAAADVELLDGTAQGLGLLALASGYGVLAVAVLRRHRDLASTLGVTALVLAVPASVELLDGTLLVVAWAAVAAALAVAARYEERLELAALAYLALALGHALALDAPPSALVVAQQHPGAGAPALLAVIAAALAFARVRGLVRAPLLWATGALALYATTLAILELFEDAGGGLDAAFQRGHTAVSAVWGIVGLALLYVGLTRGVRALQLGGFALFGISLAKLFLYDLTFLSSVARAFSFLAVGGVLLLGGFFYQRLSVDSRG